MISWFRSYIKSRLSLSLFVEANFLIPIFVMPLFVALSEDDIREQFYIYDNFINTINIYEHIKCYALYYKIVAFILIIAIPDVLYQAMMGNYPDLSFASIIIPYIYGIFILPYILLMKKNRLILSSFIITLIIILPILLSRIHISIINSKIDIDIDSDLQLLFLPFISLIYYWLLRYMVVGFLRWLGPRLWANYRPAWTLSPPLR